MAFIALILALAAASTLVYKSGRYGSFAMNDTAMIGLETVEHGNDYWLKGDMQMSDVAKFHGKAETTNAEAFCFTPEWEFDCRTVSFKVRLQAEEFWGIDATESGAVVNAVSGSPACVFLTHKDFEEECRTVVRYVSIQLNTKFDDRRRFYFNNIMFGEFTVPEELPSLEPNSTQPASPSDCSHPAPDRSLDSSDAKQNDDESAAPLVHVMLFLIVLLFF